MELDQESRVVVGRSREMGREVGMFGSGEDGKGTQIERGPHDLQATKVGRGTGTLPLKVVQTLIVVGGMETIPPAPWECLVEISPRSH